MWPTIDRRQSTPDVHPDLSPDTAAAIRALFDRYPTRRAALLPALHLAQRQIGWLPEKTVAQVADLLDLPAAQAMDTVSFYDMFHTAPVGRKVIRVCRGISCELCGQVQLLAALEAKLGVTAGQTTADGRFTLLAVECLAACDKAPVFLVNERLYEKVTPEMLGEILEKERGD